VKILVDIGHPAHVHFFKHPMRSWREQGHQMVVTSRAKEMAVDLLEAQGTPHILLTAQNRGNPLAMGGELLSRDVRLLRVVRQEKPDVLVGIGGIFVAHVGTVTRTPSIVFYDTERARMSNLLTYPFCSLVVVPECYGAWLPPWHVRYSGYHELSYLHPDHFSPDRSVAIQNGLNPDGKNFLVRTVSWQASHDYGDQGWSPDVLLAITEYLSRQGNVLISSEGALPSRLERYRYRGPPDQIHHLMAFLDLFVGESATMASECAVLGVPAIFASRIGLGYLDEQEKRFGLVFNCRTFGWESLQETIDRALSEDASAWQERRKKLLSEKRNVAGLAADLVTRYATMPRTVLGKLRPLSSALP